jgi:hypothetical protein
MSQPLPKILCEDRFLMLRPDGTRSGCLRNPLTSLVIETMGPLAPTRNLVDPTGPEPVTIVKVSGS